MHVNDHLPQIVLGPFVGALVDRWNRRLIMIIADTSIAAATGVLIFLFSTGLVQVWHIYVILFLRSLGGAFHSPAMTSSTSLRARPPRGHSAAQGPRGRPLHGPRRPGGG